MIGAGTGSRCRTRDRWRTMTASRERGQISLLILGMFLILISLVIGGVGVTAVQLARIHLLDAADGAALDASDALDADAAYKSGLAQAVRLSDGSVQDAAADYLAAQTRPPGVSSWQLVTGTGSPDGQTAVVRLSGQATIPIVGVVLRSLGGSVTITVESRARSTIQ